MDTITFPIFRDRYLVPVTETPRMYDIRPESVLIVDGRLRSVVYDGTGSSVSVRVYDRVLDLSPTHPPVEA